MANDDLINRQAAIVQEIIDYLNTEVHPIVSPEHWDIYSTLYDMVMCIDDKIASSAERHGKWEPIVIGGGVWGTQCSKCHAIDLYGKTPYCPNCGARMEVE